MNFVSVTWTADVDVLGAAVILAPQGVRAYRVVSCVVSCVVSRVVSCVE